MEKGRILYIVPRGTEVINLPLRIRDANVYEKMLFQLFNGLFGERLNNYHYHHRSFLPKGRSITANSDTKAAVLAKGRSPTAN